MRNRVNTSESNGILVGGLSGVGITGAIVLLTEVTILGGLGLSVAAVPLSAYGGYKVASLIRKLKK